MQQLPANVLDFWGKGGGPVEGEPGFHPLVAHCLDVAAVAAVLAKRPGSMFPPALATFLVVLHDIGKFSCSFQVKLHEYWPVAALGPIPATKPPNDPHDQVGLYLLSADLRDIGLRVFPVDSHWSIGREREGIWRALAGHHGRPPQIYDRGRPHDGVLTRPCIEAAQVFADAMFRLFSPEPCPGPSDEYQWEIWRQQCSWSLAGLVTLADWIGSRRAWFPYVRPHQVADPADYYHRHAVPRARAALAKAGLAPAVPSPFHGLRYLFPRIDSPSPVQTWAETVDLPEGPMMAIVEDLTGSGKTEAALTLAHRLLADGRADGIFMALPTMATANAMFGRLADCYRSLFDGNANPSLALAHGKAHLDERFRDTIDGGDDTGQTRQAADPADEPAESHCAAWLADDRRRSLFAQVGVGTLDQALMAAMPLRFAPLRLYGLTRKVLIVDEAHAFDPYMRSIMGRLLQFHAALGGSAIILSATLTRALRGELIAKFRLGLGAGGAFKPAETHYPLATLVAAGQVTETPTRPRDGLPRVVKVARLPDAAAAIDRVIALSDAGAAVVWVRNSVDDAIEAVSALRARGAQAILFHARYIMADRLALEGEVLRRFGRDSRGEERRCILVATQVVEQSLDLDFDAMVTDLAPADLLIQRAGRLWRHQRKPDHRPVAEPVLHIVSPEPVDEPAADWGRSVIPRTFSVYRDPALLWRSARAAFARGEIATPGDMRPLIEAAGDEANTPAALRRAANKAGGKRSADAAIGLMNALAFEDGYTRDSGAWDPDTVISTRLEDDPTVTLRLAVEQNGVLMPVAPGNDLPRAWALSEVRVAKRRVTGCVVPENLKRAAKASWTRRERESENIVLGMLRPDGDGYVVTLLDGDGRAFEAAYDAATGLSLPERV